MILSAQNVMKILQANFGFDIIKDDVFENSLEMSASEAYFYSAFTGSFYLNNDSYPFSPMGKHVLFTRALDYNLVTGLFNFNKGIPFLWNNPIEHSKKYPFILSKKIIVPLEIRKSSDSTYRKKLITKIRSSGKDPSNYIITPIRKDVKGFGMEHFCEYVACRFFKDNGYLTENQIPLFYDTGTPDVGVFHIPSVMEILRKYGFIANGAYILEVASASVFGFKNAGRTLKHRDFIVGEAKTSMQKTQIKKYLATGLFHKGYEIIPQKNLAETYNLITFDKSGKVLVLESDNSVEIDESKQTFYEEWLINYLKFYVLANLDSNTLLQILPKITDNKLTRKDFVNSIRSMKLEDVIKLVKNNL